VERLLSLPLRLLLLFVGLTASLLPRRAELLIGPALGRAVYRLGLFKLKTVRDNIRRCFPDLGAAGQERLASRNYEHYGVLFLEFAHFFSPFPGHYARYARSLCRISGEEHWRKAHAEGKGVIFVCSHLGFWEMAAAAGGLAGFSPLVVTTRLKPEWLHRQITECRLSTGVRAALHPGSGSAILRELRKGGSIAFMNDQYAPPPMGMPARFFGVDVNTLAAVAPLAKRTGAAVIPVLCHRDARGRSLVELEPALDLGDALDDTGAATGALAARVETWVRRHPEQWLWMHRRFKNVVWPANAVESAAGSV
jgi:Kdo2-lipid IVA lauroyltransferase/acyltransferase